MVDDKSIKIIYHEIYLSCLPSGILQLNRNVFVTNEIKL